MLNLSSKTMTNNWIIFTRGQIPLHRVDVFDQFVLFGKKFYGDNFTKILYINEGNNLWWGLDKDEVSKTGDKLLKTLSNKKRFLEHVKRYRKFFKKGLKFSEKVRHINLSLPSNSELAKLYNKLDKENGEASALANIDLDIFDVVFEDFYEEQIKKLVDKKITNKDFSDIIKELSIPALQSFVAKEEIEIIKASLKKDIKERDIQKIHNRYWWVIMGWENPVPRTLKDYFKIVKRYKKKNYEKRLKELENQEKETKSKRKKIIEKYKIKSNIKHWLNVLDEYTLLHDLRKEYQIRWMHASRLLMIESAKRIKCSSNDLVWFRHKEVCKFLRGKRFNKMEADKRKKAVCLFLNNGKIKVWSGKKAFQQHKKEIKKDNKRVDIIRGRPANGGKIIATAKVCRGAREAIRKIKKGDVLITGMTLPEYVPAMKKASAIITNEGGLTCHAAIISRELNIPCIVGTKIATKVLKDGDKIEVDADKGIIKKL